MLFLSDALLFFPVETTGARTEVGHFCFKENKRSYEDAYFEHVKQIDNIRFYENTSLFGLQILYL